MCDAATPTGDDAWEGAAAGNEEPSAEGAGDTAFAYPDTQIDLGFGGGPTGAPATDAPKQAAKQAADGDAGARPLTAKEKRQRKKMKKRAAQGLGPRSVHHT